MMADLTVGVNAVMNEQAEEESEEGISTWPKANTMERQRRLEDNR
jgi:hypothetical protein